MSAEVEIWFPASPLVFGILLTVLVVWILYSIAKFVISLWTGAGGS